MAELTSTDLLVRKAVYSAFVEAGVPLAADIAEITHLPLADVHQAYARLSDAHVLVLEPRTREVWMAMPFSARPTPFRVESGQRGWYANCAWDALGIASALECDVRFTTSCPDCDSGLTCRVEDDRLVEHTGVAHFVVPASRWWDDIGFT